MSESPEHRLRLSILNYLRTNGNTLTVADKDALIRSNGNVLSTMILYSLILGGGSYFAARATPAKKFASLIAFGGSYIGYKFSQINSMERALQPFLVVPTEFGDFVRQQAQQILPPTHKFHRLYEGISYQKSAATAETVTRAPKGTEQLEYMKNTGYINYAHAKPVDNSKDDYYYYENAQPIDSNYRGSQLPKDDSRYRTSDDVSSIKLNNLESDLRAVEEARRARLQSTRKIKPKRKEKNDDYYDEQLEFGKDDY